MELDTNLIERLNNINWFVNCGTTVQGTMGLQAKSINDAKKSILMNRWQNIILDYREDTSSKLNIRSIKGLGNEVQDWNNLNHEFKEKYLPQLQKVWEERLEELGIGESEVVSIVRFSILAIVVLDAYKEIIPVSDFFNELMAIYEAGYLPCGWKGKKAEGQFVIY